MFIESLKALFKRPVLLVPLIISWVLVAMVILWSYYNFDKFIQAKPPVSVAFVVFYLAIVAVTFIILFFNSLMLELVQQIESGTEVSLAKAWAEVINFNLITIFCLSLLWAVVIFILALLRAIFNRNSSGSRRNERFSWENSARVLAGDDGQPFRWSDFGLDVLSELIGLLVFLILPAITWENMKTKEAIKRGWRILTKHPTQFFTTYGLGFFLVFLLSVPVALVFWYSRSNEVSDAIWMLTIAYVGMVSILNIYIKQMNMALLYLWHLKWEKGGSGGDINSVPRPSLLDNVYELKNVGKSAEE